MTMPTETTLPAEKVALEPCPFCGGPAEKQLTNGKRGFIGCFTCVIGLPFNAPYGDAEIAAWNSRATPPMCPVHAELDRKDTLVLEVGNDCIACSLHERTALLSLLEPFAADDGSQDSLTVLRNLSEAEELSRLRIEWNKSWMGDRPQSMAAEKLKRLIELEAKPMTVPAPPLAAIPQVQCADCLEWIDRDANHTCRQQVRRNQRKVAK